MRKGLGQASKRCDLLKFSWWAHLFPMIFTLFEWNHMVSIILSIILSILSDPATVFRPRPRTASVSLQKHVGKWRYLHVMKGHWKGSELFTRVLHDFQRMTEKFRECPRAFNLISIIEHSSSLRQRLRLWHMWRNKNTGVIPCGTVWILRKCCEWHMLYQSP